MFLCSDELLVVQNEEVHALSQLAVIGMAPQLLPKVADLSDAHVVLGQCPALGEALTSRHASQGSSPEGTGGLDCLEGPVPMTTTPTTPQSFQAPSLRVQLGEGLASCRQRNLPRSGPSPP